MGDNEQEDGFGFVTNQPGKSTLTAKMKTVESDTEAVIGSAQDTVVGTLGGDLGEDEEWEAPELTEEQVAQVLDLFGAGELQCLFYVLVSYMQNLSVLIAVPELSWPEEWLAFVSWLQVFSLSFQDLFPSLDLGTGQAFVYGCIFGFQPLFFWLWGFAVMGENCVGRAAGLKEDEVFYIGRLRRLCNRPPWHDGHEVRMKWLETYIKSWGKTRCRILAALAAFLVVAITLAILQSTFPHPTLSAFLVLSVTATVVVLGYLLYLVVVRSFYASAKQVSNADPDPAYPGVPQFVMFFFKNWLYMEAQILLFLYIAQFMGAVRVVLTYLVPGEIGQAPFWLALVASLFYIALPLGLVGYRANYFHGYIAKYVTFDGKDPRDTEAYSDKVLAKQKEWKEQRLDLDSVLLSLLAPYRHRFQCMKAYDMGIKVLLLAAAIGGEGVAQEAMLLSITGFDAAVYLAARPYTDSGANKDAIVASASTFLIMLTVVLTARGVLPEIVSSTLLFANSALVGINFVVSFGPLRAARELWSVVRVKQAQARWARMAPEDVKGMTGEDLAAIRDWELRSALSPGQRLLLIEHHAMAAVLKLPWAAELGLAGANLGGGAVAERVQTLISKIPFARIDLTQNPRLKGDPAEALAAAIAKYQPTLPTLGDIDLGKLRAGDVGDRVYWSFRGLGDTEAFVLSRVIRDTMKETPIGIEMLTLSNNLIATAGAAALTSACEQIPDFTKLDLSNNQNGVGATSEGV